MTADLELKSGHILVVDDKLPICHLISELIEDIGYDTRIATNSKDCLNAFRREMPSMVFLDIWLHDPAMDGLQILDHLRRTNPEVPVVIMSGHGTIEIAVQAMQRGAVDFIEKPINAGRLANVVKNVMELVRLKRQVRDLQNNQSSSSVLIGSSPTMQRVREQLDRHAGTNARIVLLGPAGSGRETAARYLHGISNRRNGPFIATRFMNDSPDETAALLFGIQRKIGEPEPGLIERANLGILYFDEVGDIPLEIQVPLAKAIVNQELTRIGGETSISVDFRVISSSTLPLVQLAAEGRMSEGLCERLNTITIEIPSLAARTDDIPELAEFMIYDLHLKQGLPNKTLASEALDALMGMSWPGNLRQLHNVLERAILLNMQDRPITSEDILSSVKSADGRMRTRGNPFIDMPLREARSRFEQDYLMAQLHRFDGNISRAAEFIGMERAALHRKLKTLGIATHMVAGTRVFELMDPPSEPPSPADA